MCVAFDEVQARAQSEWAANAMVGLTGYKYIERTVSYQGLCVVFDLMRSILILAMVAVVTTKYMYKQYSRTSMARTPLGPWKFVRDMGSSSQWGLIKATGEEA